MKGKLTLLIIPALIGLSACSEDQPINSGSRIGNDLPNVQNFLRENAISIWDPTSNLRDVDVIIKAPAAVKNERGPLSPDEFNTWKTNLLEPWEGIKTKDNLNFICQLWFEGWIDSDETFSKYFIENRNQLRALGLSVESIDEIGIIEDNRNAIFYPQQNDPFILFKCGATVVYKLDRGVFAPPAKSTISFVYYLDNGKVASNFQVKSQGN
jgi:hypothetical protein